MPAINKPPTKNDSSFLPYIICVIRVTASLPFCVLVLRIYKITYMSTWILIFDQSCISAAILKLHSFFVPLVYFNSIQAFSWSTCTPYHGRRSSSRVLVKLLACGARGRDPVLPLRFPKIDYLLLPSRDMAEIPLKRRKIINTNNQPTKYCCRPTTEEKRG